MMIAALLALSIAAGEPEPIIDVHLHAMKIADSDPPNEHYCMEYLSHAPMIDPVREPLLETLAAWRQNPDCPTVVAPPATDEEGIAQSIEILQRRNIIGIVGGEPELVAKWKEAAPDRVIVSRGFNLEWDGEVTPSQLAASFRAGEFDVLGEVINQYFGYAPNAPEFEPYWAMAEANDIPVGIHIGYMPAGAVYWGTGARMSLADPLLMEDVLIRHPKLRVYIMHAGYPQIERTIALMQQFPQVYADTGMLQAMLTERGYGDFLRRMFDSGLGKRLMYGTDQIIWPQMIEHALGVVERTEAIDETQKRDLLYNNAARFFRIETGSCLSN